MTTLPTAPSKMFWPGEAQVELPKPMHECPTCYASISLRIIRAALDTLDNATEGMLNQACEMEMSYAWLQDEVEAVIGARWWNLPRAKRRLREALKTARS